ncbi:unnamed protein product [Rotaria sordida]|uniref:Uncharacterized protein n=1 Tax=Rotaria sordida TaxID=392033 RepID=A0A819DI02_9BILA|nr:unnamed protein product [Rotaria sordida]
MMIIRFVVCVILFLYLFIQNSSATYLRCTSKCTQITVPFLEPLKISNECQDNNSLINIYDYSTSCIVDYRIDYDAKNICINFKASNDTHIYDGYNQSEFLVQTIWLGFNQDSEQPNITHRKYGCSTENDCARQFYFNTIKHLITNGQLQIDKIKSKLYRQSLLPKNIALRRCEINNTTYNRSTIRCQDGLCYVNNMNEKQYCTSDKTPTFFSEFRSYLPKSTAKEIELIEYKCNKHLCNNNETIEIIKKLLRDYTNWNNINNKQNQIEEKSSSTIYQIEEKSSSTTYKIEEKSSSTTTCQTVSNILIILSLINLRFLF